MARRHRNLASLVRPWLFAITGLLLLAHLAVHGVNHLTPVQPEVLRFFDAKGELNIVSWWNAALLLAFGALAGLAALAATGRRERVAFTLMALTGAFLSLDETATIHEYYGRIFGIDLGTLTFSWVLSGLILTVVGSTVLILTGRALPRLLQRRLLVALGIYVTGVLLVEAVTGVILSRWRTRLVWVEETLQPVLVAVEEALEITGAALAVLAVLAHLQARGTIVLPPSRGAAGQAEGARLSGTGRPGG